MSYQNTSSDYTSSNLEKAAIARFRCLVGFLPDSCYIFREPWDCSTVVCLDFSHCPQFVEIAQIYASDLVQAAETLGLGNSLVFRIGSKLMGWSRAQT
jgi:hypothetical protein